jgi:hypothetical protein
MNIKNLIKDYALRDAQDSSEDIKLKQILKKFKDEDEVDDFVGDILWKNKEEQILGKALIEKFQSYANENNHDRESSKGWTEAYEHCIYSHIRTLFEEVNSGK